MISSFTGSYAFLSNFAGCSIEFDGEEYDSVEHAFQAAKTLDENERYIVRSAIWPRDAKRAGRRVTLRPDWDQIKVEVMWSLVWQKFTRPDRHGRNYFADRLLDTQLEVLVEGNHWGDTTWGVCNGHGLNLLGNILMQVRAHLLTFRLAQMGGR